MQVWDTWREITQFLSSARVALGRENRLWQTVEISDPSSVKLVVKEGTSTYTVTVKQHVGAIHSDRALLAAAMIYSYAVVEAAARTKLGISDDQSLAGGIENWGGRLLATNGKSWSDVTGGKIGCVQAAALRHAAAHGLYALDSRMAKRLARAGASPAPAAGDPVSISAPEVRRLRSNLKSLLRVSAVR